MRQIRRFECDTLSAAFLPSSVVAWERPVLPVIQKPEAVPGDVYGYRVMKQSVQYC